MCAVLLIYQMFHKLWKTSEVYSVVFLLDESLSSTDQEGIYENLSFSKLVKSLGAFSQGCNRPVCSFSVSVPRRSPFKVTTWGRWTSVWTGRCGYHGNQPLPTGTPSFIVVSSELASAPKNWLRRVRRGTTPPLRSDRSAPAQPPGLEAELGAQVHGCDMACFRRTELIIYFMFVWLHSTLCTKYALCKHITWRSYHRTEPSLNLVRHFS